MADYIRRTADPFLDDLDAETKEMMIGALEIACESREFETDEVEDIFVGSGCSSEVARRRCGELRRGLDDRAQRQVQAARRAEQARQVHAARVERVRERLLAEGAPPPRRVGGQAARGLETAPAVRRAPVALVRAALGVQRVREEVERRRPRRRAGARMRAAEVLSLIHI